VNFQAAAVVVDEPQPSKFIHKKLTRDRVVPIISASVFWLIFAIIGSGLASLQKFASSSRSRARRFAGIEELIHQVLFNPDSPGQKCEMKISENAGSSRSTRITLVFSSRMTMHSVIAVTVDMRRGCPARQP
jgi:hypothetical protein